ncbi:MAG: carboxypeptidase regulatory-like domain-containing protein, partial [Okeania sp. SIO2H7]|nr:carboxypeptidase regulatory-like domain-containing protein [Okeania sp. SIO2H7]
MPLVLGYTPTDGDRLMLVDQSSTDVITRAFGSFVDDAVVIVGGFTTVMDYQSGDSNDLEFWLNTSIPTPTTPDLRSATDTGRSTIDNLTNSNMPLFAGVAVPNSTVTLLSNVDGTIGITTADASGRWSITVSNLSAGNHAITATATDGIHTSG